METRNFLKDLEKVIEKLGYPHKVCFFTLADTDGTFMKVNFDSEDFYILFHEDRDKKIKVCYENWVADIDVTIEFKSRKKALKTVLEFRESQMIYLNQLNEIKEQFKERCREISGGD